MKRYFCFWLAIIMMLSSIPAFADTSKDTMSVGDVISIGHYEQDGNKQNGTEPIEWMVLAVEDTKALIISTKGLEAISYSDPMNVESFMDQSLSWETSYLRTWLNDNFLASAFNDEEYSSILISEITHRDATGLSKTEERVFCLSITEAEKYFPDSASMACKITDAAKDKLQLDQGAISDDGYGNWWLRDMTTAANPQKQSNFMTGTSNTAGYISEKLGIKAAKSGKGSPVFCDYLITVRPAMWISLSETTISESTSAIDPTSAAASIFNDEVFIAAYNDKLNETLATIPEDNQRTTIKNFLQLNFNKNASDDLKAHYFNLDNSVTVDYYRHSKDGWAYKIEIVLKKNSYAPSLSPVPCLLIVSTLGHFDDTLESNTPFAKIVNEFSKSSAPSIDKDDSFVFVTQDYVIGKLSGDESGNAHLVLEWVLADN